MFVAGPPVVARLGQALNKQELGGWEIQTRAGAVDDAVDTEEEAFECARRFLSYLPSSVYGLPPVAACDDDPERREEMLLERDPARPPQGLQDAADHRDGGRQGHRSSRWAAISAARSSPAWRASTAGRWRCWRATPIHYGGAWTADACQKMMRFVDLAETFHLPVVYLWTARAS